MTVVTTVSPRSLPCDFRCLARMAMMKSPSTSSPEASTASTRSPSPSNARPRSKPSAATCSCRAPMCVLPQPALMLVPSGRSNSTLTCGAGLLERQRRRPVHGAVGAVDGDAHAAQVERDALDHVPDVALHGALELLGAAEVGAGQRLQVVMLDVRLDLGLFLVAQLDAGAGEELDAVVGEGVVRGADDDAGVGAALQHQRGEPRRRDHAGDLHARAAAGEAGGERRLEHRPAEPRVAADDEQRVRAGLLRQHHGRRPAHLHGELGGQQLAGHAADAVGAEVRAHVSAARRAGRRPSWRGSGARRRAWPPATAAAATASTTTRAMKRR